MSLGNKMVWLIVMGESWMSVAISGKALVLTVSGVHDVVMG